MLPGAGFADRLADVKPYNSSIYARIFYFDTANLPRRRTLAKPSFEILQQLGRARGVRLHAPVG